MTRLRDLFPYVRSLPSALAAVGLTLDSDADGLRDVADTLDVAQVTRQVLAEVCTDEQLPLATLLPALTAVADRPISHLRTNRGRNALERASIRTWGDLGRLSPVEVRVLPSVGALTVGDILGACIEVSVRPSADGSRGTQSEPSAARIFEESEATRRVAGFLTVVATWAVQERSLTRLGDILRLDPDGGRLPSSLRAAWESLAKISPEALADRSVLETPLGDLVTDLLSDLEPNHRRVLEMRVLSTPATTLEEAGQAIGVTRERARQIQVKAEERVAAALRTPRFQPLIWRASDLRDVLGLAAPATSEETSDALDWCLRGLEDDLRPVGRQLLLRLAGPYREREGWLELVDAPQVSAQDLMAIADEQGLFTVDVAHEWLASKGVDTAFQDAWIDRTGKFRRLGDRLAVWNGSLVDKSVALLAYHETPLDAEQLVREIGEGHNARGARDRFFGDKRLMRVNRSQWALRSWDMEEYTGITDEIAQRIEAAGGRVELAVVVDELTRLFDVKAGSIKVYAEAPMFVLEDGFVRLRGEHEPFPVPRVLADCRGAFASAVDRVSVVLPVDKDTTRGSGRPCAPAVAAALGVSPGRPRTWHWAGGELLVSWPRTAAFGAAVGSTRALAQAVGASEGDSIRLDFDLSSGEVRCERIPPVIDEVPIPRAIELISGVELDGKDPLQVLAVALRVPPGEVRRSLVDRGDGLLASCLPRPEIDASLEAALLELADSLDDPA